MCSEHALCPIATYREWLEDSEFEAPSCGVCRGELSNSGHVLRLTCLHLHHAECLDVHAASHGAKCATCRQDIVPPASLDAASSPLHARLLAHLSRAAWAAPLLRSSLAALPPPAAPSTPVSLSSSSKSALLSSPAIVASAGVTSRKPAAMLSASHLLDADEDKYRRRDGFQRLAAAAPDASSPPLLGVNALSNEKKLRTRLSVPRALFLLALLLAAGFLVFVALSSTNADDVLH